MHALRAPERTPLRTAAQARVGMIGGHLLHLLAASAGGALLVAGAGWMLLLGHG